MSYQVPVIKYTLFPGFVGSARDRQTHFISAPKLASLYGVPFNECQVAKTSDPTKRLSEDTIWLYPDFTGQYILPTRKKNGKEAA